MKTDLLSFCESGGCSAKISAKDLEGILAQIPMAVHRDLLVGASTGDDAAIFRLNSETALIFTTDFFPPVCSDAYTFGKIAAVNALSDIYAMGGKPLMALNLVMFPAVGIELTELHEILKGGNDAAAAADCIITGGHTISDSIPKYGLAVVGLVHPGNIITNAAAEPGDDLILTKPLGTGIALAAHKTGIAETTVLDEAIRSMCLLNKTGSEIMQKYHIRAATDVTGFGLAGHALKMAIASNVSMKIYTESLPYFTGINQFVERGCIPGAVFRNMKSTENEIFIPWRFDYFYNVIIHDAQTSGGLLISCPAKNTKQMILDFQTDPRFGKTAVIGKVLARQPKRIYLE
ncbi:MAG: selenide, water dikinase SelD [Bacteroidales bacterium]|nr:selenide, water dikinase SelD [Bacteroidales bacterium]HOY38111.1 selenide, water dikinase SelD [Bacteroidales bacterium]